MKANIFPDPHIDHGPDVPSTLRQRGFHVYSSLFSTVCGKNCWKFTCNLRLDLVDLLLFLRGLIAYTSQQCVAKIQNMLRHTLHGHFSQHSYIARIVLRSRQPIGGIDIKYRETYFVK